MRFAGVEAAPSYGEYNFIGVMSMKMVLCLIGGDEEVDIRGGDESAPGIFGGDEGSTVN
jgi:tRNA-binding EMAP/Myf-like protein